MDKLLFNQASLSKKISVVAPVDKHFTYTDVKKYTVFFVAHSRDVYINFHKEKVFEKMAIILCPGEVLQISNFQFLRGYAFDFQLNFLREDMYYRIFGNPMRLFKITAKNELTVEKITTKLDSIFKKSDFSFNDKLEQVFRVLKTKQVFRQGDSLALKFITLVHSYYKSNHRLIHYSKLLGSTNKKLAEIFLGLGYASPHQIIKNRILIEAKRLLIYTDLPLSDICFELGFNDPAYFSRFFKKNIGVSPSFFKKNRKN